MKVQAEQGSHGQQEYHSDMKSYICLIYGRCARLIVLRRASQTKSILHLIRNLQLFHLWRRPKKRLSMPANGDEESVREF